MVLLLLDAAEAAISALRRAVARALANCCLRVAVASRAIAEAVAAICARRSWVGVGALPTFLIIGSTERNWPSGPCEAFATSGRSIPAWDGPNLKVVGVRVLIMGPRKNRTPLPSWAGPRGVIGAISAGPLRGYRRRFRAWRHNQTHGAQPFIFDCLSIERENPRGVRDFAAVRSAWVKVVDLSLIGSF